jgi:hypothetical protein
MKRFTQALTTATAALLASAIIAPAANAATIDINDLTIECHVATAVARYHNQDAMEELKNYIEVSIRDLDFYASAKDHMRVLPKLDRSALMEAVLSDCRAHPDKTIQEAIIMAFHEKRAAMIKAGDMQKAAEPPGETPPEILAAPIGPDTTCGAVRAIFDAKKPSRAKAAEVFAYIDSTMRAIDKGMSAVTGRSVLASLSEDGLQSMEATVTVGCGRDPEEKLSQEIVNVFDGYARLQGLMRGR